ncbi:MAG: hypothetical protein OEZ01_11435 [Candidatus Heimdallarchaeota archaeon]|nr:hypothetical protein [Candidatus Heimdallarchaeota archaeon]MDH5646614.1 hypothetical protein [Candidatus Heimdallarchaeota archaeon]
MRNLLFISILVVLLPLSTPDNVFAAPGDSVATAIELISGEITTGTISIANGTMYYNMTIGNSGNPVNLNVNLTGPL